MKKIFKNIILVFLISFIFLSFKNVFSAGFTDYINGIKESSETEAATGACKNVCPTGYYQLMFDLPFKKMSRCACVPLNQGVGALLTSFIQFLLSSIGVIAVIVLIIAGFMRAFSAGNINVVRRTNDMIKNAFIGLGLVIFSGSILAIINPDLVNDGIFSVSVGNVNFVCVDDIKDKSDGTQDGYFKDASDNDKMYQKNCDTVCYTPTNSNSAECCTSKVCGNQCCESGQCNSTGDACFGFVATKSNYSAGGVILEYKNVSETYTSYQCSCGTKLGQDVVSCDSSACISDTFCSCQKPSYTSINSIGGSNSGPVMSCTNNYYCAKKKAVGGSCGGSYECLSNICDNGICRPKCDSSTVGQLCSNSLSDNIDAGYVCAKNSSKTVKCYNLACNNVGDGCTKDSVDGTIKCKKAIFSGEGICKK